MTKGTRWYRRNDMRACMQWIDAALNYGYKVSVVRRTDACIVKVR